MIDLKKNISLAKHTTFKIGGPAKYFCSAKRKEDLIEAIKMAKQKNLPFFILGNGSNILFSDKGYKGLIIKSQISNLKSQKNKKDIWAEARVKLKDLVKLSTESSLTGLEWAAGIPGTVGGAVWGNAQAFNSKMSNLVKEVEVLDVKTLEINPSASLRINGERSRTIKNLSKKQCQFSNKNSIFKKKRNFIILSVILKLKKGDERDIQKKIKEYLKYRRKNHPLNFPSAGCAFKNYQGEIKNQKLLEDFSELKKFNKLGIIPSAYLIEKCGLKGRQIGGAQISEKHANFIINLGNAKSKDVLVLIKLIKQKVKNKFGIVLKKEIEVVK